MVSYFSENYPNLHYPLAKKGSGDAGFRKGQIGALHAIGAHFTVREDPAVIVMPTGAGKTAVLMASPFLLEANRVLVVTPSKIVREQIAENFTSLRTIRKIGAVSMLANPKILEAEKRISTFDSWEILRNFDVVIGTPNCVSPALKDIPSPPPDLFDLILVDEAHHSPAATWNELFASFPNARRILFTATPFRSDRKEIKGHIAFSYPLSQAFDDEVYGEINYVPVKPDPSSSNDLTIALETERIYRADRANKLDHVIMVRTAELKRAEELLSLYKEHTSLRLELVTSKTSSKQIKDTLAKLRAFELDGIICVAMLGEGFDFPNLKIAALHTPHKSLAITLQFIGRFARSGEVGNFGAASFVAVPSEIQVEATRLYKEGAIWQDIIKDLSESKIDKEIDVRTRLSSFEFRSNEEPESGDLSLYSLRPMFHAKVFNVASDMVEVDKSISFAPPVRNIHQQFSSDLNASVLILQQNTRPRWINVPLFEKVEHELVVIYYSAGTELLFICSSRPDDVIYNQIIRQICIVPPSTLSLSRVESVLSDLDEISAFHCGMLNPTSGGGRPKYTAFAGDGAHNAVSPADGLLHAKGHLMTTATDGTKKVNIGVSRSSKVWSLTSKQIPELIDWCETQAKKILEGKKVVLNCAWDNLSSDEPVDCIPGRPIGASWTWGAHSEIPIFRFVDRDGGVTESPIVEIDLIVNKTGCDDKSVRFSLSIELIRHDLIYRMDPEPQFEEIDGNPCGVFVLDGDYEVPLCQFLNLRLPIDFHFPDFSSLNGRNLTKPNSSLDTFDRDQIEQVDWTAAKVDITREFGPDRGGLRTIHTYLDAEFSSRAGEVVVYDHGTGEVADFVTFKELNTSDEIEISLYHCKGSGGSTPAERVDDFYEVSMQAVKSLKWTINPIALIDQLLYRLDSREGRSRMVQGTRSDLEAFKAKLKWRKPKTVMCIVQPGISREALSYMSTVLEASNGFLLKARCESLRVLGSS